MRSFAFFAAVLALVVTAHAAVFSDPFTDANGTALSAHTPTTGTWSSVDARLKINSNMVRVVSPFAPSDFAAARVDQSSATYDVQGTLVFFRSGTDDQYRIYGMNLKWDYGAGTGYEIRVTGAGLIQIFNGAAFYTSRDGSALITAGANTLRVDISNNGPNVDIVCRLNGTLVGTTFTDSFGSQVTTAGKAGISIQDFDGGGGIDSFIYNDANPNLATGTANTTTASTAAVHLTASAATGGAGSYTYRWHRATVYGFTPGTGNALTALGSYLNFDDSTAVTGTVYYYVLEANDGTDTVYSNQVAGRLWKAPLVVGFLGDSITGGYAGAGNPLVPPGDLVASFYREFDGERIVTAANQGVGGSTTATWQPGGANMLAADAAFAGAGVTAVMVCLGTNDALDASLDATTYQTNLAAICAHLVGAGYKVIVSYPTGTLPSTAGYTSAMYDRLQSYLPAVVAVCNGSTIILGDTQMRFRLLEEPSLWLSSDGVHLYTATYSILARFMAGALYRALNPAGGGGSSSGIIGSGFLGF